MAVDGDVYGTVAGVEALVGDVIVNTSTARLFSSSTVPTLAQVEGFIDDVGFRLNVHLESEGYTTPVTVVADKNTFNWLKAANNSGAAARVLSALPAESWTDPDNEGTAQSRRNGLEQEVSRIIKAIKERALPAARADVDTDDFIMGSQLDEDGLTKLPMFTRGQFDYPGTRTLAE